MATQPKCFNCGESPAAQVWNLKPPSHKKWICQDKRCWNAWWKLTDKEKI